MEQNRAGGGARRLRIGLTAASSGELYNSGEDGAGAEKSGPSPPPPGRLHRALIKSIEAEPVHHSRATDTILYSIMFITHVNNEA